MKLVEFTVAVESDCGLELVGVIWKKGGERTLESVADLVVRVPELGRCVAVEVGSIEENTWEDLRGVIMGERPARISRWYCRIVGYYSRVSNWNRSKVAELVDRQKGDYGVPAADDLGAAWVRAGSVPRSAP